MGKSTLVSSANSSVIAFLSAFGSSLLSIFPSKTLQLRPTPTKKIQKETSNIYIYIIFLHGHGTGYIPDL